MTTKPFNLQEALAGAPVTTRNGLPVVDFHIFPSLPDRLCVIRQDSKEGDYSSIWLSLDGKLLPNRDSETDLVMAPTTKTGWIVIVFTPNSSAWVNGPFSVEDAAHTHMSACGVRPEHYTVKEISWEE